MNKKKSIEESLSGLFSSGEPQPVEAAGQTAAMNTEEATGSEEEELIATIEDEAFREELKERLRTRRAIGRGRPLKTADRRGRRTDGERRTSIVMDAQQWETLKEISLRETLTMKELFTAAFAKYIELYEAKNGKVVLQERTTKSAYDII